MFTSPARQRTFAIKNETKTKRKKTAKTSSKQQNDNTLTSTNNNNKNNNNKNPNFDRSNPLTWNQPLRENDDDERTNSFAVTDIVAQVKDVQTLSDEDLAKIVGMAGARVPQMVTDSSFKQMQRTNGDDDDEDDEDGVARTASEAIKEGLRHYKEKDFVRAEESFRNGLKLPGTGPVRFRKAKVAPAGPSAGYESRELSGAEVVACQYNRACCFAQMGDVDEGLECLKLAIENGFDDFRYLRGDKDVQVLRTDRRFESLMDRFEPKGAVGALENLFKGGNPGGVVGMLIDKMNKRGE